jgi:outer membrane protein assembly factor BamB
VLGATIVVSVYFAQIATAENWPRFRGPNGSGVSDAAGIPIEWTENDYRWKIELPGIGHSAPVVWGQKIFVTSGDKSGARIISCLNAADGRTLWSREFPAATHKTHLRNSFASGSPAVDERHVYVCWGTPEEYVVLALDHNGKDAWKRDLGPYGGSHGQGTSPIVFDDLVILDSDKPKDNFLLALDSSSGKTRWELKLGTDRASYSTPCVYQPAGQPPTLIFTDWERGIQGVDPRSGKLLWEIDAFGGKDKEARRAIGSPIVAGNLVIGSCGFTNGKKFVVAVEPKRASPADKPTVREVYRLEKAVPQIPTVLAHNGLLFLWNDSGIVTCADAATGEVYWQERVGGNFNGSPVCIAGRLYCISEEGEVVVLAASKDFQLLARNSLGEASRSTPAIADGTLYLRTYSHLYAIGAKK